MGLVLGAALPLAAAPFVADRLPVPAEFGIYPRPLAEAALYGGLTALLFTVWPLARARDIRAAELFRDLTAGRRALAAPASTSPRPPLLAAALVAAATLLSGRRSSRSAPPAASPARSSSSSPRPAGLRRLARRLGRGRPRPAAARRCAGRSPPSAGRRARPPRSCSPLGLGLSVLAAVGQIDWNLRNLITRDLPERAPAFFFVDIQNDQLDGFLERASAVGRASSAIETAPMLRGIITRINGRPAREVAGRALGAERRPRRHLRRDPAAGHGDHRGRVVARGLCRPAADELRRRGGRARWG